VREKECVRDSAFESTRERDSEKERESARIRARERKDFDNAFSIMIYIHNTYSC